jgi:ferredoxin
MRRPDSTPSYEETVMVTPVVDAELCSGCGLCEAICPDVFELGDDGLAHTVDGSRCDQASCCEEAAESCPEDAITLNESTESE